MIKFFRHIRKQLLTEKKFSNYFFYALGEVVLVVFGILIAIQVNTWNEKRKQDLLENEYYCRLLEDVLHDQENITNLIALSEARLKASNQVVRLLQKDKTLKEEVGLQISLSIKAIYYDFKPNNAAFEDLKSGANLNIIQDKSIIKALNTYLNKVEGLISVIKINGQNAVNINFAHQDNFSNGWIEAQMSSDRFIKGMEPDVYKAMPLDREGIISVEVKKRLYNDALYYISANSRQRELYNFIKDEADILMKSLLLKCPDQGNN